MNHTIKIKYSWRRPNGKKISEGVIADILETEALARIFQMIQDGYTSGELNACVYDVEYWGHWEVEFSK